MSNENDEVIAHSAIDAPGVSGGGSSCGIQFNLTDEEPEVLAHQAEEDEEPEVLAHQADEDEEDLADCVIQFNAN